MEKSKILKESAGLNYSSLEKDPNFPKSRAQYFKSLIKGFWDNLVKGFPKNLLIMLAIMFAYWLFNIVYLAFIHDSSRIGGNESFMAYLFSGSVYSDVKGVFWDGSSWPLVISFAFALTFFIKSLISRMIKNGFGAPFKDFASIPYKIKNIRKYSHIDKKKVIFIPMAIAFVISFIIINPYTLIVFTLMLLFSFAKGLDSGLIANMFVYDIAVNLSKEKNKRKKIISSADSSLKVLGLALGFLLYSILVLIMWFFLNYNLWARLGVTVVFVILFIMLALGFNFKSKGAKTALFAFAVLGIIYLRYTNVIADDGGWTESGDLEGWLKNPGTKDMAKDGLLSSIGIMLAFLVETVLNNALEHFSGLPISNLNTFISADYTDHAQVAKDFYSAAIPVPGLNDAIGDMIDDINAGLSGNSTSGGSGGFDSSGGGYDGGSGGSSSGSGSYGDSGSSNGSGGSDSYGDSGSSDDFGSSDGSDPTDDFGSSDDSGKDPTDPFKKKKKNDEV